MIKICPICKTQNNQNASLCFNCGAAIQVVTTSQEYDFQHAETDLYEGDLQRTGQIYLLGIIIALTIAMFGGLLLAVGPSVFSIINLPQAETVPGDTPTPRPTLSVPTVTPAPPTPIPTNTPLPSDTPLPPPTATPCYQTVQTGDSLSALVTRCGHQHLDVFDLVVEINGLADVNSIQQGQILEIPWPTPTFNPESIEPTEQVELGLTGSDESNDTTVSAFAENFDPLFVPTATLQPGIQYHVVQQGENIMSIIVQHNASVEILSQLNPEMSFSQCDFGETFGGPRCTVMIFENQQVRVPAPTPTPTLPPTATGSETPTPTVTATFNAPSIQSPSNHAFFRRNELITLRWIPSGTLGANEFYKIQVEDITSEITHIAETQDTAFIIPDTWHGQIEPRHEYRWSVSVVSADNPDTPKYTTETLTFDWEG